MPPTDVDTSTGGGKSALRARLRALRSRAAQDNPDAGAALSEHFPDELVPGPGGVLTAYVPFRDEIDPGGVMAQAQARGARLALPVVVAKDAPLIFRLFNLGDSLERGVLGLREPLRDADEVEPDVLLVPLLGFDRRGGRLGYGGGHYDRTLEQLRARTSVIAVGVAFEAQRLDAVPLEPHDQTLDWIVTEAAAYRVTGDEESV